MTGENLHDKAHCVCYYVTVEFLAKKGKVMLVHCTVKGV